MQCRLCGDALKRALLRIVTVRLIRLVAFAFGHGAGGLGFSLVVTSYALCQKTLPDNVFGPRSLA